MWKAVPQPCDRILLKLFISKEDSFMIEYWKNNDFYIFKEKNDAGTDLRPERNW